MGKREPSYTVGGNVNWCRHYDKQCRVSFKIKIQLPDDPAVQLLGIYMKKTLNLTRYIHPNIHSSTVYNNKDTGQT